LKVIGTYRSVRLFVGCGGGDERGFLTKNDTLRVRGASASTNEWGQELTSPMWGPVKGLFMTKRGKKT